MHYSGVIKEKEAHPKAVESIWTYSLEPGGYTETGIEEIIYEMA